MRERHGIFRQPEHTTGYLNAKHFAVPCASGVSADTLAAARASTARQTPKREPKVSAGTQLHSSPPAPPASPPASAASVLSSCSAKPALTPASAAALPTFDRGISAAALFRDDTTLAAMPSSEDSALLFQLFAWASEALQGLLALATADNAAAQERVAAAQAELSRAREQCDSPAL